MCAEGSGVPALPVKGRRLPRRGAAEISLDKSVGVYEMENGGKGIAAGRNFTCRGLGISQSVARVGRGSRIQGGWSYTGSPLSPPAHLGPIPPSRCPDLL